MVSQKRDYCISVASLRYGSLRLIISITFNAEEVGHASHVL